MGLKGCSRHLPETLLNDQIPIRACAQWDDAATGFLETDLVAREGDNAIGEDADVSTSRTCSHTHSVMSPRKNSPSRSRDSR